MNKLFLIAFFFSLQIFAETPAPTPPWAHESELGIVTVSGNTEKTAAFPGRRPGTGALGRRTQTKFGQTPATG